MPKADFFTQQCADGGRRSGLAVDGETHWYRYDPVWEDPALLFGIDLTAEGAAVPDDPDGVRAWYARTAGDYRAMLIDAADLLRGGGVVAEWPLTSRRAADGVELGVNVHATYGFGVQNLTTEMEALAGTLEDRLDALSRFDQGRYARDRAAWLDRSRLKAAA